MNKLSSLDARYFEETKDLRDYFSEYAWFKTRLLVEIEYMKLLANSHQVGIIKLTDEEVKGLDSIHTNFDVQSQMGLAIRKYEAQTKHDIKALEYYIKEKYQELSLNPKYLEMIHWGLTSQDVNSVSFSYNFKNGCLNVILPEIQKIISVLEKMTANYHDIVFPAYTHGQVATPTNLSKEFFVFAERLTRLFSQLEIHLHNHMTTKFGGATGGLNVHRALFPNLDWKSIFNWWIKEIFDLERQQYTTQIEHYDSLTTALNYLQQIATVCQDLSQDIWLYISRDFLVQRRENQEQIGSSTMPHKINPIRFENAEANFQKAVSDFQFLSRKLPVSRLQRDLTDSTTLRTLGTSMGHFLLACKSLLRGLDLITPNLDVIKANLEDYSVLGELVQSMLRLRGVSGAYEKVKDKIKKNINKNEYLEMIDELREHLNLDDYNFLIQMTPSTFSPIE